MQSFAEIKNSLNKMLVGKNNQPYQAIIRYFLKNLTADMDAYELGKLIGVIEQIRINNHTIEKHLDKKQIKLDAYSDKPEGFPKNIVQKIKNESKAIIRDHHLSPVRQKKSNADFLNLMMSMHGLLSGLMQKTLARANTEQDNFIFSVNYEQSRINSSYALQRINEESKEDRLTDSQYDALHDIERKLTRFSEGVLTRNQNAQPSIHYSKVNVSGNEDQIKRAIEKFSGDKIDSPGSKASKIYYFGHQFILAELLNEFNSSTRLNQQEVTAVKNVSTIHWRKNLDGKIYCDTSLEVFALKQYENDEDTNFVLNAEGSSLAKRESPLDFEMDNLTETRLRAPIGSLKVTFELENVNNKYHLKPVTALVSYNSSEIESLRAPRPLPVSSDGYRNWAPINFIRKVELNDLEKVKYSIALLKSFNAEEWKALKLYLKSRPALKLKIAKIYFYGFLNFYLNVDTKYGAFENNSFKKSLINLYGNEAEFNIYLSESKSVYKLDSIQKRFIKFFKKLKSNSDDLHLQELVGILNDIKNIAKQIKDDCLLENPSILLKYILEQLNLKKDFHLTVEDKKKLSSIYTLIVKNKVFPENHPALLLIKALNDKFPSKIKEELVEFSYNGKTVKEKPLPVNEENFATRILIETEIRIISDLIYKARVTIQDKLPSFLGDECNRLCSLDDKLSKIQKELNEARGTRVPITFPHEKLQKAKHVDMASISYADSFSFKRSSSQFLGLIVSFSLCH